MTPKFETTSRSASAIPAAGSLGALLCLFLGACASAPKTGLPPVFLREYSIAASQNLELYASPLGLEEVPGQANMAFAQVSFGLRVAKASKAGEIKSYVVLVWADLDNDGAWQAGEPRARQEGDLGLGSASMQGALRSKGPKQVTWMLSAEVQHLSGEQSRVTAKLTP